MKGATENEMGEWHHWLNGHEFEQTPWDGEGQGSLACYSHGVVKSQTWLRDWTTIEKNTFKNKILFLSWKSRVLNVNTVNCPFNIT